MPTGTLGTAARPLSQADIERGLRGLGLASGMSVEVHSSLSAFGQVDGGAQTVVSALLRVVGRRGSVVMPAFRYSLPQPLTDTDRARGLTAKLRKLAPDCQERTGMGIIADTFRRRPDVLTGPGFHRVCAWGRESRKHSLGFQHLLDSDGWALLLGVDIHRLSTMHYAEGRAGGIPSEVAACYAASPDLLDDYPPDQWYLETGPTPEDGWAKIQVEAARRGLIRQLSIGPAVCMFFRAAQVTALYEQALRADPYSLFGLAAPTA